LAAPKQIEELVERFERNVESYRSGGYNETQLRREFIDPFFKALGWDVDNERGYAEAYKDVVHEDAIKVGSTVKAPDYCFRIGGVRKFFVEAKKPSVNLKDDISPAFQLRRYSWSAKHLPLGILTDFEELAVYDGRIKPEKSDRASKARVKYLTYKEYVDRWDEIASIFSREEVLKGSFDRYVESTRAKRGTAEVDAAFLKDIESWRDELARNIALRNPDLTTRELNFAVQRTIDRIVFLRICEDRGIEKYGWLQSLLEGPRIYPRLVELFIRADERYNSGLFAFADDPARKEPPDELTPSLEIDDKILKEIIKDLYYPDSPYEFSVVPPEILGQVYEQFLGKVISLTAGHRAKVEYKPEVRKAGGVYYTPAYIVEYIVENTVGKLLEGQTPAAVSDLRILDPACGSGSFLIGAYQRLLDWHRDWYVNKLVPLLEAGHPASSKEVALLLPGGGDAASRAGRGRERGNKIKKGRAEPNENSFPIFQAKGGEWKLTTEERKRILLNNIYGVDIDPQAVEVTKLSLHLKVLEGESEETLSKQLKLFQERALPDLGENVKCGNSLIGWDILESNPGMSEEEIERINPFDWEREFPDIMGRGGFDAVIGNPPYVRPHNLEPEVKDYFWGHYSTFIRKSDLYCCFIERPFAFLKNDGVFGYIVSNGWLRLDSFEELRRLLLYRTSVQKIIDFTGHVFQDANVKASILIFAKRASSGQIIDAATIEPNSNLKTIRFKSIPQNSFIDSYKNIFDLSLEIEQENIKQKMRNRRSRLGDLFNISFGVKTGDDSKFLTYSPNSPDHKPLLRGEDVRRYSIKFKGEYVWYVPDKMREHRKTARPGNSERFEQPKVLIRDTGDGLQGTFDSENYYVKDVLVVSDSGKKDDILKYLMGILNSKLMRFYYETSFPTLHVQRDELASLPIRTIDFSDHQDVARHDSMVKLVENMLDLHRRLAEAKTGHEKTLLSRQIEATDRQIDDLVYQLYGLTEEEIAIVEDAAR